jgi:ABC-type multidrug transport system fused ATPase/permease subunit
MKIKKNYFSKVFYLAGKYDYNILIIIPLYFIVISSLDLLSVGLIGTYVGYIIDPKLLDNEVISNYLYHWSNFLNLDNLIISTGFLLVLIFLIKAIVAIFLYKKIISFAHNKQADLRNRLMNAYQNMNFSDYLKRDSSEYITAVGSLVKNYGSALQATIQFIGDVVVSLSLIIFLFFVSGSILFFLIFGLVILILLYRRIAINELEIYGTKLNRAYDRLYQTINEFFQGFKEIKILGYSDYFKNEILKSSKQIASSDIRQNFVTIIPRYVLELLLIVFITTLVTSTILLNKDLDLLIPTIGIFAAASLRLIPISNQILRYLATFKYTANSVDKIYLDLISHRPAINNEQKNKVSANDTVTFKSLKIQNLYFSYNTSRKNIFNNLNFELTKGQAIGIVGPSGSGKSTLVNIMLGLLKPIDGKILLNGKELDSDINKFRNLIAYLPQETFLINDNILSNIALGVDASQIDQDQLLLSLDNSKLSEFVNGLKENIYTQVGEKGLSISGGQRQRISFARAFYFNREILVLDEPTSSLDKNSESAIVDYLREIKGSKTIIIISHRSNSLSFCDEIYQIKNGKLVKEGS